MSSTSTKRRIYNVTLIGTGSVGKSSITFQFTNGTFVEKYDPTIEDSYIKEIELDGKSVRLEITDTVGQEEYPALLDHLIKNGRSFLLVYSVVSLPSFNELCKLYYKIQKLRKPIPPIIIVCNKIDLLVDSQDRPVSTDIVTDFMKKNNLTFFIETSAKTGTNIDQAFFMAINALKRYMIKNPKEFEQPRRRNSCCVI